MNKSIKTSVALTPAQRDKAARLAAKLGIHRSAVVGLLIDHAVIVDCPVTVNLSAKNNRVALVSQAQSDAAIDA
ncbi:MAG: hypothetical protein R3C14_54330 [Caldilineaceae bacterium]